MKSSRKKRTSKERNEMTDQEFVELLEKIWPSEDSEEDEEEDE